MEIIMGALIVYGLMHAFRKAGQAAGQGVAKARSSAPKSGDRKIMADSHRRAATGWWVNEARKGFPVTRGGFQHGWREHTAHAAQTKADAAEHKQTVRQALEEHRRRVEGAQPPTQSDDGKPPGDRLPADQITGQTQTATGGHDMAACKDPDCACHQGKADKTGGSQPAAPGSNGQAPASGQSTGGTMPTSTNTGDTTYEAAHNTIGQIKALADSVDIAEPLAEAQQLADGLPAMTPTDSETPGHISDAVAHLQAAERERQAAAESATAAEGTLTANFGAQHEAVSSTGHDAEIGFHGVS